MNKAVCKEKISTAYPSKGDRIVDNRLFNIFLIDEPSRKILFFSFASKKDQQEIINEAKANMHELMTYLRSL